MEVWYFVAFIHQVDRTVVTTSAIETATIKSHLTYGEVFSNLILSSLLFIFLVHFPKCYFDAFVLLY